MAVAIRIARRYFTGKKSLQAINIISKISMGAIAVSAAAMIILFSVFNGLENTIKELFTSFYPDLKVSKATGKFFTLDASQKQKLENLAWVGHISYSLEDMVLLTNESEQRPAVLKGVDNQWFAISGLQKFMFDGKAEWDQHSAGAVIVGLNIASALNLSSQDAFSSLNIYYPRLDANFVANPESALKRLNVRPQGFFHIQEDFDGRYVLIPLGTAQGFFDRPQQLSSIEINTVGKVSEAEIKQSFQEIFGDGFVVENRYQQNKSLFMIMQMEKWAVYVILLFVLVIASFNMVGSLSMLVLEKKKDIFILKSLGASASLVRRIFILEGLLLSAVGALIGVGLGYLVCLLQQYFGFIQLPDGFVMSAYPVAFKLSDFFLVVATSIVIGLLAAWYPARKAALQSSFIIEG